jgi:hypothetical protein
MTTPERRLRRGWRRLREHPEALEDRLTRVELVVRFVAPLVPAYHVQTACRAWLGPTHEASIHSAEYGFWGYWGGLALVTVLTLGSRRAYQQGIAEHDVGISPAGPDTGPR